MTKALSWGQDCMLVSPKYFDVQYKINPYMDPEVNVNQKKAQAQWDKLKHELELAGAKVVVLENPPEDCLDMVFAMNLAYVTKSEENGRTAVLASMRYAERQQEPKATEPFLAKMGCDIVRVDEARGFFEPGDFFPWQDEYLVAGVDARTTHASAEAVAQAFGRTLIMMKAKTAEAYHLDLSFCPLSSTEALIWPGAFSTEDLENLLAVVPDPILITDDEATKDFSANSVIIGKTILMPINTSQRLQDILAQRKYTVRLLDVSEFEKGGGSVRCMVNSLDFPE